MDCTKVLLSLDLPSLPEIFTIPSKFITMMIFSIYSGIDWDISGVTGSNGFFSCSLVLFQAPFPPMLCICGK